MTTFLGGTTRAAGRIALRLVMVLAFVVFVAIGIGPLTGRYRVVTVLSGSMHPTLPTGSMVISVPESTRDVRVGQIITFQAPTAGHVVETHRVVQIVEHGEHPIVRTQGDANSTPDPWVARLDAGPVWVTQAEVPLLGRAVHGMRAPWVHTLTVLLVPVLFALSALVDIWAPTEGRSRRRRRIALGS
jgi:signal peptidase